MLIGELRITASPNKKKIVILFCGSLDGGSCLFAVPGAEAAGIKLSLQAIVDIDVDIIATVV